MKTTVWITAQFEGFHRWKDAPDSVGFLRDWHRHIFHVRLSVPVGHLDRDVEFITLKKEMEEHLHHKYRGKRFESSCETIAADLLREFSACLVEVSEDGENGAVVVAEEKDDLPSRKTWLGCYLGTEAEGPHRGESVLYVPGTTSPEEFQLVWGKVWDKVTRVYYGAGNDRGVREDTFRAMERMSLPLDVEVERVPPWLSLGKGTTIISLSPDDADRCSFVKHEVGGNFVWVGEGKRLYVTAMDDPLYALDRGVE